MIVRLSERCFREWRDVAPMLATIMSDLLDIWPGSELVVNSIWRSADEDAALGASGVHATMPHRAIDLRTLDIGQAAADKVAATINFRWQYDPARPEMVVAYGKPHGEGPHLHLQVHPNTRRRPPGDQVA